MKGKERLNSVATATENERMTADREAQELKRRVGENLETLRKRRGLSLERLASLSGVSRAMLGQIEAGESTPTIALLWKVARGLDVRFADLLGDDAEAGDVQLLPAGKAKILRSADEGFQSRALFPFDSRRRAEFYELRLRGGRAEHAEAHAEGTYENLFVQSGRLRLTISAENYELRAGDAIYFRADVPHVYQNPGSRETVMYLVMTYAEPRS